MPTTDDYGQGIEIAALTDAPDASTLARDIANAIASRSVLRYASAAARGVDIKFPVDGMATYLTAEMQLQVRISGVWVVIGSSLSSWTTISLPAGFAHDGNANGTVQYRRINLFGEPSVQLKGALAITYSPAIPNGGIFTSAVLPVDARPSSLRTLVVPCSDSGSERITMKLDAQTDGHLRITGTNSTTNRPPWIGLNGVFYSL